MLDCLICCLTTQSTAMVSQDVAPIFSDFYPADIENAMASVKLIWACVFACANCSLSHAAARLMNS